MIVVDKLCYRSGLRYVNAAEKFIFSIITLLFCVVSRSLVIAGIAFAINGWLTMKKGRIPGALYAKLLAVPFSFLILSTLAVIVNVSKVPLDAYAIPVGSFFITGSFQSMMFGVQLIGTAMASVSCLYFLSLNTTMTDFLGVLAKLHCPEILMELMLLIYRFIFVLMETASAIMVSQKSRLGNKDFRTSVDSFGKMGAGLLIRAFKRSNALYDAMESRCYDGKIRVLEENHSAKRKEIAAIAVFELVLLGITVWRKMI
ncbi:cobalt ECF transporter T component CbiQ [Muricomes intestini]|jgi:cobalt/nickel transport system permease protein|uniref:Cobalt/nickel transport system permease protein n=1 Tax=Muricomes intestini TaxID=1796634 RepID=A0A4R3K6C8_9FIRM|nr:cobalt ECF transporter T component CbiQ [Muricomes intestini]TCS78317.1 cobalt/nickel transport system permease protein [Muricomes intestini]HAX51710.1 cobalt ECF transporter T component CbiQ [Lachnospiraceae bacterium]HCR84644.1 cobalt ECF transporter T component CbiQ [Lachnospiraceae bacterium]